MESEDPRAQSPPRQRGGGRIMALDVGGKRTGVAVADELGIIATPIGYVRRGTGDRAAFQELIERWQVDALVVGLPTSLSGKEGPQAAEVRTYANALAKELSLPLEFWDERLTTTIAERALIAGGHRRNRRKERVDAVAAAVILQGYLDAKRRKLDSGRRV
jgi:putative Holliday junction resolvase